MPLYSVKEVYFIYVCMKDKYTLSRVSEITGTTVSDIRESAQSKGVILPLEDDVEISLDLIKQIDLSLAYKMRYANAQHLNVEVDSLAGPKVVDKIDLSLFEKKVKKKKILPVELSELSTAMGESFNSDSEISSEVSKEDISGEKTDSQDDVAESLNLIINELQGALSYPEAITLNDILRIRSKWESYDAHIRRKESRTYAKLLDQLYYAINLSDEERAQTYKVNLDRRVSICEGLEALGMSEDSETPLGHRISNLTVEWLGAGPVSTDDWILIEKRYKTAKDNLKKLKPNTDTLKSKKKTDEPKGPVVGYVKWYDYSKGFGYAVTNNKCLDEESPYRLIDVRINQKDIVDSSTRFLEKSLVVFSVAKDKNRRNALIATNVRKVNSSDADIDLILGYRGKYAKIYGTDSKSYERYDIDIIPFQFNKLWKEDSLSSVFFIRLMSNLISLDDECRKEVIDELLSNPATYRLIDNSIDKITSCVDAPHVASIIKSRIVGASVKQLQWIAIKRYMQEGLDISEYYPQLMSDINNRTTIDIALKSFFNGISNDDLMALVQSVDISELSDLMVNFLYEQHKEVFYHVFDNAESITDICQILLFSIDNKFEHLINVSEWQSTIEWLKTQPASLVYQVVKGFVENVDLQNDAVFPLFIPDMLHKGLSVTDEDEKIQTLQQLPQEYAIEVALKYYTGTNVCDSILGDYWNSVKANIPYVVFDMEYDGDTISEFAFRQESNTRAYQGEDQIRALMRAMKRKDIVVGYQIKGHKLNLLQVKGLDSDAFIWDTLEMELLLDPCRYAYALQTSHVSKDNTELVDRLFWNQLYRLSQQPELCETLKDYLPNCINDIFSSLRDPRLEPIFSNESKDENAFFQKLDSISSSVEDKLSNLSTDEINDSYLFVAPKPFWGKIAQYLPLNFIGVEDDINYKVLSKQKLQDNPLEDTFLQTILVRFMEMSKTPLIVNLAHFLRLNYLHDDILSKYIDEYSPSRGICCDLSGLDSCNARSNFSKIYFVGCGMDSRLDQLPLSITMTTADFLSKGCWIPMRLAGANYMIVNNQEIQALGLVGLPDDTANVWVERQLSGEFKFWYNVNYEQRISILKENNPTAEFEYFSWVKTPSSGKVTLVSSVKRGGYSCSQNRVGSISRFRPMYWSTQLRMLKSIQKEEKSAPMIYVLDNQNELSAVEAHARSLGFYVPETELMKDKVEEICNHTNSLLIIPQETFPEVVSLRHFTRFVYIWDNLSVDKSRMMWSGQMPFGDEAETESEQNNPSSEATPQKCILASWPTIEYHFSYIRANNPHSKLYVLEPYFDDFGELADAWGADKFAPQLWKSEDEYNSDLLMASGFHQDIQEAAIMDNDSDADIDTAMEVIRRIFLPAYDWRGSQLDVLPAVLSRKRDYLISIPTGGGKSILFQGPALYRSAFNNRLSIVITPLKALMEDQVNKLHDPSLGFYTNVDYLNSDKTLSEVQQIYRKIKGGELALLYVTPERFRARGFLSALEIRMKKDNGLEYFIFDEAHCVSQWGQEFRPDYLNVMTWCKTFKEKYPSMCVTLYSATVTKQVQETISKYLPDVERRGQKEEDYNPIRSHIGMSFIDVENNDSARIAAIVKYIIEKKIDNAKSRMLVFCRTRQQCELCAESIYDALVAQNIINDDDEISPIGYFHAGMDAEDREDAYQHFKRGDISILCATKAFGMGMDIPNVHYIVHFSPPSVLEDYLQEVGRAGRSKEDYEAAGFVGNKLLPTVCLVSKEDFKKAKELLIKSMLSWSNLNDIRKAVMDYIKKIQSLDATIEKPIVLPMDLWRKDKMDEAYTSFRLGLYWLECLDRLKLGFTCPSHINIRLKTKDENVRTSWKISELSRVYDYIKTNHVQGDEDVCQISISELKDGLNIGLGKLIDSLVRCVSLGWLSVEQDMRCEITTTRTSEVLYKVKWNNKVTLDIIFDAIGSILGGVQVGCEFVMDAHYRDEILKESVAEANLKTRIHKKKNRRGEEVSKEYMIWVDEKDITSKKIGLSLAQSYKRDLFRKRAKHIYSIMQLLPGVSIKTELDSHTNQPQQLINVKDDRWKLRLSEFKKDCFELLKYIVSTNNKLGSRGERMNWAACMIDLKLVDKGFVYLDNLLYILRVLGYVKSGSMLPMGLEVFTTKDSDRAVNEKIKPDSNDERVKTDFDLMNKMRKIRLAAMTAFAGKGKSNINQFISEYFKCITFDDFFTLVSTYYDENNKADREFIAAMQDEAIIKEEKQLGKEQLPIYQAPLDEDINVIAGPGSGKTHILTLRCARMIYRENVSPSEILVLAYNRAVVVELRNRLDRLFGRLGLSRSASQVHVHTFSALSKVICGKALDEVPLNEWEERLLETLKSSPMIVKKILPNIKYIMIDEFQDITQTRLNSIFTLRRIYPGVRIFTIGDKNQSIYGFDKKIDGIPESTSPEYYYHQLVSKLQPHEYTMRTNYRSYQKILDAASVYLKNPEETPVAAKLVMDHEPTDYVKVVQWEKGMKYWTDELPELVVEAQASLTNEERYQRIEDIAVFFRSNDEVYRGYERVSKMNLQNVRLRIQGASACELFRVREIYEVINYLYSDSTREIIVSGSQTQNELRSYIEGLMNQYPNWDRFYLDFAYTLILDYLEFVAAEENTYTFGQMADSIKESTMADDGQIFKIYDRYQSDRIDRTRQVNVILTTMHKVKGLEFDAVIVTPSFASLPFDGRENSDINFNAPLTKDEGQELEEERRLQYVAYTRARKKLSVYRFKREIALDHMCKIARQDSKLGWNDKAGIDKYFLSFLATDWYFNNNAYVERFLAKNEPLTIVPHRNGDKYQIKHNGTIIGQLSRNSDIFNKAQMNAPNGMGLPILNGIFVSEVYVWTLEDTLRYDAEKGTDFQKFWCDKAKQKGYIYIVDFAGYAK